MKLCLSSAKYQFSPLFIFQNPNPPKFFSKIAVKSRAPSSPLRKLPPSPLRKLPPSSSKQYSPSVEERFLSLQSNNEDEEEKKVGNDEKIIREGGSDIILVICRLMMESSTAASLDGEESESSVEESEDGEGESAMPSSRSTIDLGFSKFAKKMSIFEPKQTDGGPDKPLTINLDLSLYRAKSLARKFQYVETHGLGEYIAQEEMDRKLDSGGPLRVNTLHSRKLMPLRYLFSKLWKVSVS